MPFFLKYVNPKIFEVVKISTLYFTIDYCLEYFNELRKTFHLDLNKKKISH